MGEPPNGTQAVDRAALLVRTVVEADEPMSFADLADACALPKSTTSRLLSALERTGLIERNSSGLYVAGRLFWLYATRHDPWEEFLRLARPTLEAVGEATGETVSIATARGDQLVHLDQVDSVYMLGTRDWTDIDVPAHTSATGKVLIAAGLLPAPAELHARTGQTITRPAALERINGQILEQGYATAIDELEIGLAGVAVPVTGLKGHVIASIGISGPTARLQERLPELSRLLIGKADQLSTLLRRRTREEGVE